MISICEKNLDSKFASSKFMVMAFVDANPSLIAHIQPGNVFGVTCTASSSLQIAWVAMFRNNYNLILFFYEL